MNSRSGISKVEVLLAGGLLVLLAAVALPWLLGAKSDHIQQRSANNLLQWGISLNLYLIDHNNRLPLPGSDQPSDDEIESWYNALPLYISRKPITELAPGPFPEGTEESIWVNPAAIKQASTLPGQGYIFYYAMNRHLIGQSENEALRIYQVDNPTATVFLSETCSHLPYMDSAGLYYGFGKGPSSSDSMAHVLFCDGHVELVPRSRFENTGELPPIHWRPEREP
jgi:prepilin-type processing-associated H-X9-DG protein